MKAETYQALSDELNENTIALPSATAININTVKPTVLAALAGISPDEAEKIVTKIQAAKNGYSSPGAALSFIGADIRKSIEPLLVVKSDYFEIKVRGAYGGQYAYLTTIIRRNKKAGEDGATFEIISRNRGRRFIFPWTADYNTSSGNDLNKL
jgi:type II secretory pathway component PulK